jgi:hypothetical protein
MERLLDLSHDLGKYLRLPLSMLPAAADAGQVRKALRAALQQTRSAAGQVLPAREIWRRFQADLEPSLSGLSAWHVLEDAVDRALSWEHALGGSAPIDRSAAERDLRAVGEAIDALIEAVQRRGG